MPEQESITFQPNQALQSGLLDQYNFLRRSYEGGAAYKEGKYLIKHVREKDPDYIRRLEQASFVNFCGDTVDLYNSYLYRVPPVRDFKVEDPALDSFREDADLDGRPWQKVVRELAKLAGAMGIMGAIVDKPQAQEGQEPKSKAAEQDAGIRPYVATYPPQSIWDWKFKRNAQGQMVLVELVLEEECFDGKPEIMLWREATVERWKQKAEGKWTQEGETRINELGRIPFALLRNRDSFKRMTGVADIADIANVNRRIYYLDSDALEIIENTAFPILEGSAEAVSTDQEKVIGATKLLKRPEGGVNESGFRWIEAPHTSLEQILKHRTASIEDIKGMAKTGQGEVQKQQAESGVALELRFQQLNALLAEKAENAEDFERIIFELVGLWEDVDYGAVIKYPRSFGVRDLTNDLNTALTAKALIPSRTFGAEMAKEFVGRVLHEDTKPDIIKKIEKELDQGPPEIGSELDGTDEDDQGGDE